MQAVGSRMSCTRGRLHVYLAVAPAAGKTYAMLAEGRRLVVAGADVVVGLAETHGRTDTDAMLRTLDQIPLRQVTYRGKTFVELDVDALLARRPAVVLVDELAHTCVPGSRHEKRWEDVEELLDAGIDVITCLNVQHLDSLNDAVEGLTRAAQAETVPDTVVACADRVDFLDITPERLRSRISGGGVFEPGSAEAALGGFYSADRLALLRELATGWLGERGLLKTAPPATPNSTAAPPVTTDRVVVALTGAPEGRHVLRRAAQIAASVRAELIGVHVREPSGLIEAEPAWLDSQRRLLSELGGRYTALAGIDVATTVLDFARTENARQLVLGATRRSRLKELLHGSVINKAVRAAGPIEVHVIPSRAGRRMEPATLGARTRPRRVELPGPRRLAAWVLAVIAPVVVTVGLVPLRSSLGLTGALMCALVTVVGAALLGGTRPALVATGVAVLASDFFYTEPLYSLRIGNSTDVVALLTFGVVAVAVGGLVDLLTRQGVRVARANAEAEDLARLAADSLSAPGRLAETVASIRRTFDLDGVTLLRRSSGGWEVEAAVGETRLEHPDEAAYSVEIARERVLCLVGTRLTDQEATLLRVFLAQLRLARERAVLHALAHEQKDRS